MGKMKKGDLVRLSSNCFTTANGGSRKYPSGTHGDDDLQIFRALIERSFNPVKSIKVKSINGIAADESPYCSALIKYGFRKEYQGLSLWAYE